MKHYAKVLYVIDGDFSEFETLKQVLGYAEKYESALTFFDIAQTVDSSTRFSVTSLPLNGLRDRTLRSRLRCLEALISMIGPRACTLQARTSFGNRAREIVSEAARGKYDLVIKRSEKGSTDKRVRKDCQCPVWVLGPEDFTASGEIITSNAPLMASRSDKHMPRICAQGS